MDAKNTTILTDEDLNEIYGWVDGYTLSRPKNNITRDFSDALLAAEIIKSHYDKFVDLHNYPSTHNIKQKYTNWDTLNRKILSKLGFQVKPDEIDKIVNCKPEAVERVLLTLKRHLEDMKNKPLLLGNKKKREGSVPGQDTNNYGPIYTNVISPIETPGNLMINQHIPNMMHPMGYASMGGVGGMVQNGAAIFNPMQGMKYPGNMIPPDTPISKTPGVEKENNPTRDRRRSPAIQRAGMQMAGFENPPQQPPVSKQPQVPPKIPAGPSNNRTVKAQKPAHIDYESQYQGMTTKQLIGVIREKDSKINDLIEAVEILELKVSKLEQLNQIKDAEIKVWQSK